MRYSFGIFWDYENVNVSDVQTIKRFLSRMKYLGEVHIAAAFADWQLFPRPSAEALSQEGVTLIHIPDARPDSADKAMTNYVLDEMEKLPDLKTFVIVSGDSDLQFVVDRLKKKSKEVWVVANSFNTSSIMIDAGDKYFDIHDFVSQSGPYPRGEVVEPKLLRTAAIVTVHEAIERIQKEGNKPGTGHVKVVVKKLDFGFSEKALGFEDWGAFMKWGIKEGSLEGTGVGIELILAIPKDVPHKYLEHRKTRDEVYKTVFSTIEDMLNRNQRIALIYRPDTEEMPITDTLISNLRSTGVNHVALGFRSVADLILATMRRRKISSIPTDWRNNEFVLIPDYNSTEITNWFNSLPEEIRGSEYVTLSGREVWDVRFRLHKNTLKGTTELLSNQDIRNKFLRIMMKNASIKLPFALKLFFYGMLYYGFDCESIFQSLVKYHLNEIGTDKFTCPKK